MTHAPTRWRLASLALAACCLLAMPEPASAKWPPPAGAEQALTGYLGRVALLPPETHAGLSLYPIVAAQDFPLEGTLTLDEALSRKVLVVTELGGGAEVNTLMLENRSEQPVFVMSGEILRGAKQDRTMQSDLLIPPRSGQMKVSVFCTEQGRWRETSGAFQSAEAAVPNSVRQAAKVGKAQAQVWSEIARNQSRLDVKAPTQAAKEVYEAPQVKQDLQPFLDRLSGLPKRHGHVVGVAAAVGDRLIAVDVFGDDALFRRLYPKLLRSYAVEALGQKAARPLKAEVVLKALAGPRRGPWAEKPTEGIGAALAYAQGRDHGSALLHEGMTLHADFFPDVPEVKTEAPRIPNLQQRREQRPGNR